MSFFFVTTGMLLISSLFIICMWYRLVRKTLKTEPNTYANFKLMLTGVGLMLQSAGLIVSASARMLQEVYGFNVKVTVAFCVIAIVIADFLFILAASIRGIDRKYLLAFMISMITWLLGNGVYNLVERFYP